MPFFQRNEPSETELRETAQELSLVNHQPSARQLVDYASRKGIEVTIEAPHKMGQFRVLTPEYDNYGWVPAREAVNDYLDEMGDKLRGASFDRETVFAFARIASAGDNFDYLFSDADGGIYHVNLDNGWDPKVVRIARDLVGLTGDFKFDSLQPPVHHFEATSYRISDHLPEDLLVHIDIHGFLLDQYEDVLRTLFGRKGCGIQMETWKVSEPAKEDSSHSHHHVTLHLNGKGYPLKIENSKWFDFSLARQINDHLNRMGQPQRLALLHQNDWDEHHALALLTPVELESLHDKNLIIES